ncbi:Sodium/hydrogen exchanger family-domain-containing protein [Leucosporidium creatinivorum]|uniref:Sodium/hydrogen exchanger family-domain-containing protein n=1 Tax=Leucosporidium creatinivorum TaxID=106004 RepID=A0A1Y2E5V2_9BASI|nr:Sodium/hydrogen exchanger family-domain-containing protein [Leucosporidium creatinivorum]
MATSQPVTYHEPSLPHLLTLIAFLYLLQVSRTLADRALGAGLLGEIAVGVVFGPVAGIMLQEWEETLVAVGYIGLVVIVFEGGLHLSPTHFLPSLPLAVGAVLQGAALIDDVVALVLLSVITALGEGDGGSEGLGWTIGRPILASVVLAAVAPAVAFGPARWMWRRAGGGKLVEKGGARAELAVGVAALSAFLAIAYYAGTTMLLGAFLAGVFLYALPEEDSKVSFSRTYHTHVETLQTYIFCPLFFGSIGLTIPFLSLWTGRVIWRGIVYSILMTLGKVLVGLTILAVDAFASPSPSPSSSSSPAKELPLSAEASTMAERGDGDLRRAGEGQPSSKAELFKKETLPAGAFLGIALVARGEVGVLILQVAYSSSSSTDGTGSRVLGTEAYLVALWAVAVCTIVGPVAFSWLAKRFGASIYKGRWGAQVGGK